MDTPMRALLKIILCFGFLGFVGALAFQSFLWSGKAFSQEVVTPPAATTPSSPSPEAKTAPTAPSAPWYKDPALTAVAGALATGVAALIAGLISLWVRWLTKKHEMQKIALEKQLEIYGTLFEKISEFDILDPVTPKELLDHIIELMATFEKSYPFLDKHTIKVFDKEISIPFNQKEFTNMLLSEDADKGYTKVYTEIRHRLADKVMPAAKKFLDRFK
jgi:hypothetical protein